MIVVSIILSTISVFIIAQIFLGAITNKARKIPKQLVFNMEEAIEFCAEALPDDVTSQITYDELHQAIRIHLEWIQAYHWTPEGYSQSASVFDSNQPLNYFIERMDNLPLKLNQDQIQKIMQANYEYLKAKDAMIIAQKEDSIKDLKDLKQISNE